MPKEHVQSSYALMIAAQRGRMGTRGERSRTAAHWAHAETGFAMRILDGLSAAEAVPHTVIHLVPRGAGDQAKLPDLGREFVR